MSIKYDTNYYESKRYFSGKYSDTEGSRVWNDRFRNIITKSVNGKLLDIGTAYGFFLKACESGFETHGCDISPYAIVKAQKNSPKSNLIVCDISKGIPYGDDTFDVVTMFDVIEHIDKYDELLQDVYRVMKPYGILVLTTPNRWSNDCLFFGKDYWYKRDITHKIIFSKSHLTKVLSRAGFIEIDIHTIEFLHFVIDIFQSLSKKNKSEERTSREFINIPPSFMKRVFQLLHNIPSPFGANLYAFCRKQA
ncbi:MAG: class I SAM-dependent methyltransferase [Candidatus Methanoperedens sp.]|nr:class I SAM-dependent methyltransferase [Candidatus Methanoperedens sp.]